MALTLKLVRSGDFIADISEVDLNSSSGVLKLRHDGWQGQWTMGLAGLDGEPVTETISMIADVSDFNTLATAIQSIDEKLREITWYQDEISEQYSVWLQCQLTDDTYPRQALILDARGDMGRSLFSGTGDPGTFPPTFTLAVERMPYWEGTEPLSFESIAIGTLGGTYDYGTNDGEIDGDVPARIAKYKVRTYSPSNPLTEVWLGFRTDRFGDRNNFEPVWECEDGTAGTDTSSSSDANASGSSKMLCDFSTDETIANRVTVKVDDVTSNYSDQRGRFTVLLRAKVGASTVCRVRLLDGFNEADNWRTQSRTVISSTDWRLYQLGEVSIPPVRGKTLPSSLRRYSLRVEGERTSGSNDLHLDSLVLIPIGEGGVHFENAKMAANYETYVYTYPDGSRDGETMNGTYPVTTLAVEGGNFWLPVGDGTLVFAAQRDADGNDLTDVCTHTFHYFERWRTLRGGIE